MGSVSPAASEGQCVKYDTSDLSDTAAAANGDGIFPVPSDGSFTPETGDISGALSGWPDMKDSAVTDTMSLDASESGWKCCLIVL